MPEDALFAILGSDATRVTDQEIVLGDDTIQLIVIWDEFDAALADIRSSRLEAELSSDPAQWRIEVHLLCYPGTWSNCACRFFKTAQIVLGLVGFEMRFDRATILYYPLRDLIPLTAR